jgi:hypothetical protein
MWQLSTEIESWQVNENLLMEDAVTTAYGYNNADALIVNDTYTWSGVVSGKIQLLPDYFPKLNVFWNVPNGLNYISLQDSYHSYVMDILY